MGLKSAVLILAAWFGGTPTLVAPACCPAGASEACGGCDSGEACCVTTLGAADRTAVPPAGPGDVADAPVLPPLLTPPVEARIRGARVAVAPDRPLYLRHRTLLI